MKAKELRFKKLETPAKPIALSDYSYVVLKTKPYIKNGAEVTPSRYHFPMRVSHIAWDAKYMGAIDAYAEVNKPVGSA